MHYIEIGFCFKELILINPCDLLELTNKSRTNLCFMMDFIYLLYRLYCQGKKGCLTEISEAVEDGHMTTLTTVYSALLFMDRYKNS